MKPKPGNKLNVLLCHSLKFVFSGLLQQFTCIKGKNNCKKIHITSFSSDTHTIHGWMDGWMIDGWMDG